MIQGCPLAPHQLCFQKLLTLPGMAWPQWHRTLGCPERWTASERFLDSENGGFIRNLTFLIRETSKATLVISNSDVSKMIPMTWGSLERLMSGPHICPNVPKFNLAPGAGLLPELASKSCSAGPKCAREPANNLTARGKIFLFGNTATHCLLAYRTPKWLF